MNYAVTGELKPSSRFGIATIIKAVLEKTTAATVTTTVATYQTNKTVLAIAAKSRHGLGAKKPPLYLTDLEGGGDMSNYIPIGSGIGVLLLFEVLIMGREATAYNYRDIDHECLSMKTAAVTVSTTVAMNLMNYAVLGKLAARIGIATTELVLIKTTAVTVNTTAKTLRTKITAVGKY